MNMATKSEMEDLISNQPSIFYCLMENSLMVARNIRQDFKDVNNWMGNLARKHLISSGKMNSELLSVDLNTRLEKWKPPPPKNPDGVLSIYSKMALQADCGACWETRLSE